MSINMYKRNIERLSKGKADLETKISQENGKIAKLEKDMAGISQAIQRTKNASTIKTKQSQYQSKQQKLSQAQKTLGQLESKKASVIRDLNQNIERLNKAEEREQKKKITEDQKRRSEELKHARSMTSEYKKQASLHKQISQQPLVIELSKLPSKINALFLAANPVDQPLLRLDAEIRSITEKLRSSEYRDAIQLISRWALRTEDILQALNEHKPHIVHFSGHGSPENDLVLETAEGTAKLVPKEVITATMKTMSDNIKLVIFNNCFSSGQAEAVTQHVEASIGMNDAISDEAARVFAAQFYSAIGFGRSVQSAFDQGVTALLLEGIPEENTPTLYVHDDVDPNEMVLVRPPDM